MVRPRLLPARAAASRRGAAGGGDGRFPAYGRRLAGAAGDRRLYRGGGGEHRLRGAGAGAGRQCGEGTFALARPGAGPEKPRGAPAHAGDRRRSSGPGAAGRQQSGLDGAGSDRLRAAPAALPALPHRLRLPGGEGGRPGEVSRRPAETRTRASPPRGGGGGEGRARPSLPPARGPLADGRPVGAALERRRPGGAGSRRALRRQVDAGERLGGARHSITYRDLELDVHRARLGRSATRAEIESGWFGRRERAGLPLSSLVEKVLRVLDRT